MRLRFFLSALISLSFPNFAYVQQHNPVTYLIGN